MRTAELIQLRREVHQWRISDQGAMRKLRELKERVVLALNLDPCQVESMGENAIELIASLIDYMEDETGD